MKPKPKQYTEKKNEYAVMLSAAQGAPCEYEPLDNKEEQQLVGCHRNELGSILG